MPLVIGQSKQLAEQATRQLDALATAQAPLIDQLSLMQTARQARLTQLNALQQFAQEDRQNGIQDIQLQTELYNVARQYEMDVQKEHQAAQNFALENNVDTSFYTIGETIYRTSDGKAYSTPEEFFIDAGVKSFEEAGARGLISQPETQSSEMDKLLTPTEAAKLGVPYGTTRGQAAQAGMIPSSESKKGTENPTDTEADGTPIVPKTLSENNIRQFLLKMKSTYSGENEYYDIWGVAAEMIENAGGDPNKYDKVFWTIFHPEGIEGYNKEQAKKKDNKSSSGMSDEEFLKQLNGEG